MHRASAILQNVAHLRATVEDQAQRIPHSQTKCRPHRAYNRSPSTATSPEAGSTELCNNPPGVQLRLEDAVEAAEASDPESQPSSAARSHLEGPEEPGEAARSGGVGPGMVETERDRLIRLVRPWLCA